MLSTSVLNTAWIEPPSRPESVDTLLSGVDRYNPQNASLLEDYLYHEQLENGTYDCLANVALLKLFQFNPTLVTESGWTDDSAYTIFLILLQALAHEPLGPDFNLSMALLGEQLVRAACTRLLRPQTPAYSSKPALAGYTQLSELATLLQQRRFPQAWSLLQSDEFNSPIGPTLSAMPQFNSILRKSIALHAVRPTFRAIERKRFSEWLGVGASGADSVEEDEAEVETLVKELGWTVDGDLIRIPIDAENNTTPASQQRETVGLDKLSKLLRTAA